MAAPAHPHGVKGGWAYIMTNKPGGALYVGVTADLVARVAQHRAGTGSAHCRRYNLNRLVYAEHYPTIDEAIAREKALKEWRRAWKIELIEAVNSDWADLWETINA
ncbi:GIY-YIG nuclease family protein [Sphingomonas parva]|uniref:GIY-YIG nuclease family protein n=1 Tax=Sphingomonas parva TaxID=2555898 RepID=A0A4Y8ZPN4_9SPHN|nr:GIY-YIG nuclease family protein [Sphingomonas parva]TFI57963.1 GIY-YIG nuclease family protein [Sphingomonas parva]